MCFLIIYEQSESAPKSTDQKSPSVLGTVWKVSVFFWSGLQISIENTQIGGVESCKKKIGENEIETYMALLKNKI